MFANLSSNLILICRTPRKNEVTLFHEVKQNYSFSGSCTYTIWVSFFVLFSFFVLGMSDVRTVKFGSTGPSFLLWCGPHAMLSQ